MPRLTLDLPPETTPEHVRLFIRLQQLETWVRELVYMEMKCNYSTEWWDKCEAALRRTRRPGIRPARALAPGTDNIRTWQPQRMTLSGSLRSIRH